MLEVICFITQIQSHIYHKCDNLIAYAYTQSLLLNIIEAEQLHVIPKGEHT